MKSSMQRASEGWIGSNLGMFMGQKASVPIAEWEKGRLQW